MKLTNVPMAKKNRWWRLLLVTLVLVLIIGFLVYTSEDPRWGGGYWIKWVISHFQMPYLTARSIVNGIRKTLHFLGYGGIGLLCWFYFYLWGLKKPLLVGLILTALVAVLDEMAQSMTTFRFGKPQDVALDIVGAVVVTGVVRVLRARRAER